MKKIIFILLFIPFVLSAQTFYVAPDGSGSDVADGSVSTPWATLSYAVTQVSTDDSIHMQVGTHTINTTVNIPITVSLLGADSTSIITSGLLGSEGNYIITLHSGSYSDGSQSISNLKFNGNSLAVGGGISIEKRDSVIIHDCVFRDFNYTAIRLAGDGGAIGVDPYGSPTYPTNYTKGCEIHDNTITNSAYFSGYGRGCINIGGQKDLLIYNNTITQVGRASGSNGYPIKTSGFLNGMKIYNNTLTKYGDNFGFAIEGFFYTGVEIYSNTIQGSVDCNYSKDTLGYTYGVWIHDNTLGPASSSAFNFTGVTLEFGTRNVIIEKNQFRNINLGIYHTMRDPEPWVKRERISYNLFTNVGIGSDAHYHSAIRYGETQYDFELDSIDIWNNVFSADETQDAYFGIHMRGFDTATYINIENNIFENFSSRWFTTNIGGSMNIASFDNNICFNNGNSNNPLFDGGTPSNYTIADTLKRDPVFVSSSDYSLQSSSPAINAGTSVGLTTDYLGYPVPFNSIPDIGSYEYGSGIIHPINFYGRTLRFNNKTLK